MGNCPCFYVLQCGKADRAPLSKKSKEKALKPSGFKAFPVSMGYEKDIFGSFAYDFELSQKLIFG